MSNQETLEFIMDLLQDEEGISYKRMFGGYALLKNELAVALILRSEVFMKAVSYTHLTLPTIYSV